MNMKKDLQYGYIVEFIDGRTGKIVVLSNNKKYICRIDYDENNNQDIAYFNIDDWNDNGVHYLSERADRMHTGRIYTKTMDIIRVYGYTSDIELELSNEFSTKNRPIVWERKSDFDLQNIPTVDLLLELKSRGFKNINKVFMDEIKSNKETNITDI